MRAARQNPGTGSLRKEWLLTGKSGERPLGLHEGVIGDPAETCRKSGAPQRGPGGRRGAWEGDVGLAGVRSPACHPDLHSAAGSLLINRPTSCG